MVGRRFDRLVARCRRVWLLPLLMLVSIPSAFAQVCTNPAPPTGTMISTLSYTLMNNCWSCNLFTSVFYGLRAMVNTSYATIIGTGSNDVGLPLIGITIVSITLMVKFIPFLMGSSGAFETIASLRLFVFRVAVVFLVFIGAGSASIVTNKNFLSDFFIDGPLALGTSVGVALGGVTSAALAQSLPSQMTQGVGGGGVQNLYSTYGSATSGADASGGFGSSSLEQITVGDATSMLFSLHQMGVVGLVTGLWMAIENPHVGSVSDAGSTFVGEGAAMFMIWTFFMFTLTFGLKYIDALIRSMLIFSLTPFFLYLWIFDSTRGMAIQALKSGLSLAAVFAVSGVVFTVAYYIMGLGYYNVFNNQSLAFAGLHSLLCGLGSSQIASMIGSSGQQGSSLNWMSYFYLVGSCSVATACSSLAFDIAGQIFAFQSADMGIASSVGGDLQNAGAQAVNIFRGGR